MAPFDLTAALGPAGAHLVYLALGIGFGATLEMAGFGNSRKLAGQFYLQDLTVFKVMFTAIVTAMVLVFGASALGWLDYQAIWVNPTYLWPGIVGGLIMGVGFIIGGFCPGTSLVAVATLKLDGVAFLLGAFGGVFAFGETVHLFDGFWNSSALGRLTVPDLLGVDTGVVVLAVVGVAVLLFMGAEWVERRGAGDAELAAPKRRLRRAGAGTLVAAALAVLVIGQPTADQRWARMEDQQERLERRKVQIQAGELLSLMHDDGLNLVLLDVRSEHDFNLFHLRDARRVAALEVEGLPSALLGEPARTVVVLVSNGETAATTAWRALTVAGVPNVYLLEGGINRWLNLFREDRTVLTSRPDAPFLEATAGAAYGATEPLRHRFDRAYGGVHPAALPSLEEGDPRLDFLSRVELQERAAPKKGGCG